MNQPVAAPHQSFLSIGSEVPFDKKSSFPPGEAKNSETFGIYHSLKRSVSWVLGGKAARIAKLATPTDSKIFINPIQQTALLRELREANSLPYMACATMQPLCCVGFGAALKKRLPPAGDSPNLTQF